MIQKNVKIFWTENVKIRKQIYAFKGYVSSPKVESLNYFNPELQLKDTEPSIKIKLIDLLAKFSIRNNIRFSVKKDRKWR